MALWGKTDASGDIPKWLEASANNTNESHDKDNAVFLDVAEAKVPSNRAKGLVTPGWNLYKEYTDQNGNTRRIVENIVAMKMSAADAGDALGDDSVAADPTITIATQPQAASANSTTNAVFTVVASVDNGGALAYSWESGNSTVFSAISAGAGISGLGTDTLTLTPAATGEHINGRYFRVVLSSDGAANVTSDSALLTKS